MQQVAEIIYFPVDQGGEISPPPSRHYGPLLVSLAVLSIIVVAYFTLAILHPPVMVVGVKFRGEISYSIPLPISSLTEKEAALKVTVPAIATGKTQVPDGYATGKVRFVSVENAPVFFAQGTQIAEIQGVKYRLSQGVTIPAYGAAPGVVDATVVADKPGPEGNQAGGIGGYVFRGGVRVQGISPLSGGSVKVLQTFTPEDIAAMKAKLVDEIGVKLRGEITAATPKGHQAIGGEILRTDFTLPTAGGEMTGQPAEATAQLRFRIYDPAALVEKYATAVESAALGPAIFQGVQPDFTLQYIRKVDPSSIVEKLEGWQGDRKQYTALVAYLRSLPEIESLNAPKLPDKWVLNIKVAIDEKA
jgi:hypothetical protein